MNKHLDTSNIPKHTNGNNKGRFDWKNSIGKEVEFEYDDLKGIIKILDYSTKKSNKSQSTKGILTLQYKENIMTTSTSNLLQLNIPSLFNKEKQTTKYKYEIGDIIDKIDQSSIVKEQCRISVKAKNKYETTRGYLLECLSCGYKYKTREDRLSSCPVCGIRSTYSEKFIYSIFKQANIKFEVQKEFDWLINRWYDVYLPEYNAIIEINGIQHYKPTKLKNRDIINIDKVYDECKKSDELKMNAAIDNNMSYYIINACDINSLFEEARKSLPFIDFKNISKTECEKFAHYNKIRPYFELWNDGYELDEIASKMNKSVGTVQSKLRIAAKYNLCIYDKKKNMIYGVKNPNKVS